MKAVKCNGVELNSQINHFGFLSRVCFFLFFKNIEGGKSKSEMNWGVKKKNEIREEK